MVKDNNEQPGKWNKVKYNIIEHVTRRKLTNVNKIYDATQIKRVEYIIKWKTINNSYWNSHKII